jgi:hypothetical protein
MVASVYKWFPALFLALFSLGFGPRPAVVPPPPHPLYVSVTEMDYNAADKTLEISCKVFTDDFEKAMSRANNVLVDLYKPKDSALIQKQVADYLRQHFLVKVDGKPVALEFVGHELEEQSTWSYFQVSKVGAAPKRIEIMTNIFFELFDKQINILHVSVNGARKSTKLDYPATSATFDY